MRNVADANANLSAKQDPVLFECAPIFWALTPSDAA